MGFLVVHAVSPAVLFFHCPDKWPEIFAIRSHTILTYFVAGGHKSRLSRIVNTSIYTGIH